MANAKNTKFVGQNEDGTYYCGKCGQSGFANKQKLWGHLGQCRGYSKIISEAKKSQIEADKNLAFFEVKGTSIPKSFEVGTSGLAFKGTSTLGNEADLPTYLEPTSEVPQRPLKTALKNDLENLMRQNFILKARNNDLQKIAFNHNSHVMRSPPRNFSGPQDMVNETFGTLFQIPLIKWIAGLTALAIVINFAKKHIVEMLDGLNDMDKKEKKKKK